MPQPCCDHHHEPAPRPMSGIVRYLSWFLAFSSLYAMSAVCPFCGRAGCPVGAGSAGVVGLAFASLMQWGRACRGALARAFRR